MIAVIKNIFFKNLNLRQTVIKNTFWLTLSEIIARLIGLFLIIYITRILGVEEYGKFTFALSFASVIALLSDLGIIDIATREFSKNKENEKNFDSIFSLGVILGIITLLLACIISFFITQEISLQIMMWVLTFFIICNNLFGIFFAFLRARLRMEYEAFIRVLQSISSLVLVLFVLFNFPKAINVSYGYLISGLMVLFCVALYFGIKVKPITVNLNKIDFKLLKLSWPLSLGLMPSWLFISLNAVFLGYFGLITENGWYGAVARIAIGTMIIANLLVKSFYPILSNFFFNNREKMEKTWNYLLELMIVLSVPMVIGTITIAPGLIELLYGADFYPAIPALPLLIWVVAISFLNYPYTIIMIISNNQRSNFALIIFGIIINTILNFILIPFYGISGAITSTIVAALFVFLGTIIFSLKAKIFILPNLRIIKTIIISFISGFLMHFIITNKYILDLNIIAVSLLAIVSYFLIFGLLYKIALLLLKRINRIILIKQN